MLDGDWSSDVCSSDLIYGVVSGTLLLDGETWELEPNTWALAEQALVIL
jgi:hypothetical protein